MQRRLSRFALVTLLATITTLGGSQALAHDAAGSTEAVVPVPDVVFNGEVYLSIPVFGPAAAGKEILHSTLDLTFTSPVGGTLASDIVIEIVFPLTTSSPTWVVHGFELGWPAAYGTFSATLDSDDFNGVLAGPVGGATAWHTTIGSQTGSTYGHFVDSTLTLELAAGVCQWNLGLAGPGDMSLAVCGDELATGGTATLAVDGAPASATVFLAVSLDFDPTPFMGGILAPLPLAIIIPLPADASGSAQQSVPGGNGPVSVYVQAVAEDASQVPYGYVISNVLRVQLLP